MDDIARIAAQLPAATPEPIARALCHACDAWMAALADRLRSLVLFGSVSRGTATTASDIDLLVVATTLPRSLRDRRRELLAVWDSVRDRRGLAAVEWNLIVKSPEEATFHSPLYLDIVENGILLFDREGWFASVLASLRARMRELDSRRVFLPDGLVVLGSEAGLSSR
jgi:predicted nucleotidyltransferase